MVGTHGDRGVYERRERVMWRRDSCRWGCYIRQLTDVGLWTRQSPGGLQAGGRESGVVESGELQAGGLQSRATRFGSGDALTRLGVYSLGVYSLGV